MHPLFDFSETVAIVTGGTSGIGLASATLLAELGAKIVVTCENPQAGNEAEEKFASRGFDASVQPCDVRNRQELQELVDTTLNKYGRLDTLVCAAGVVPHTGPSISSTDAHWSETMTINLQSAMWLSGLAIPHMSKNPRGGSVVFIASIAAVRGNKNIGLYGISKAGLLQLARNLAVEFGQKNVRANTVSPGLIETNFAKSMMANQVLMAKRMGLTPLRRVGQANEVAGVVAMLAAPAGAFITGQNIIVDGGTVITDGS